MNAKSWVISTEDLLEGTTLSFDLRDSNGNLLHKAGIPISAKLKQRLAENGIESVTILGTAELSPDRVAAVLLDSFSPELIQALQSSMSTAIDMACNAMRSLRDGEKFSTEAFADGLDPLLDSASKDLAATLSVLSIQQPGSNADMIERISERSAKLSMLGIVTAIAQGQPETFVNDIGLAGLLHDCSLVFHPTLVDRATSQALSPSELPIYHSHPLESAKILRKSGGVPGEVIEIVEQVHEQANGSGFPRGLNLKECNYAATILNVADAYLTLTDSSVDRRFVQSDALLYLVSQATKGVFCARTIQSMMRAMSVYPIGTIVELDNSTKAVVVGSNRENPMKPLVRTLDAAKTKIDLSQSLRSIVGPFADETTGRQRLPRSEMNKIFWRLDAIEQPDT